MENKKLPIVNISNLIPQKAPFIMVSTLQDFNHERIVSSLQIAENNLFLEKNIFVEPGLIENMAQTVALHTGYDYYLKGEEAPTGYIGSIKSISINKLPKLNDTIKTEAIILHEFMGITMVTIKVFNDKNEVIATGEMKTVIAN